MLVSAIRRREETAMRSDCMHCQIDYELFKERAQGSRCSHGRGTPRARAARVDGPPAPARVIRNGVVRLPRHKRADTIASTVPTPLT
jgi:hypothetical protein